MSQNYGRVIKKTTNEITRTHTTSTELIQNQNWSTSLFRYSHREKKRKENCLLRLLNVKTVMKVSSTQVLQPNSFFQLLDFVQKYPCQLQNHPSKTFHQVKKQVVKLWVYKVSNWHWRRTAELVMTNSQQPCDEEQGKKWFKLRGSRYEKWGISP